MKCDECQALVQEYYDGELDRLTAGAVSVHVGSCSSCSAALERLRLEQQTYQRYDRNLDVSPALWFKVRAQLAEENGRPEVGWFRRSQIGFGRLLSLRFSAATAAALILFAILVTVVVMKYSNRPETLGQTAVVDQAPAAPKPGSGEASSEPRKKAGEISEETPELKKDLAVMPKAERARGRSLARNESGSPAQLVREAEQKYLSAISLLSRAARQRQSQIDDQTRAKLDGALAAVDRTILSTRRAVQRNPNDPVAVQYMLAAYNKKVDVLKEMSNY